MANTKLTAAIIDQLKLATAGSGIIGREELTTLVLGSEGMAPEAVAAGKTNISKLQENVDTTLSNILGNEAFAGISFTPAQIKAGREIIAMSLDPMHALRNMHKLRAPEGMENADVIIGNETMDVNDAITTMVSTEAYDGQSNANAPYFSLVAAIVGSTQDKVSETFYPTLSIDPTVNGIVIGCEYTSFAKAYTRGVDGKVIDFKRKAVVKSIYDKGIFGVDRNKVFPVVRPENASVVLDSIESWLEDNGVEKVETAPLAFNKSFDILGLSQTDTLIAKGVMSNEDALDVTMNLTDVWMSLTGDVSGSTVTEQFKTDFSVFPFSNFFAGVQDHDKDLSLSFKTGSLRFKTGVSKNITDAISPLLGTLPANHTVTLEVVLHGEANTESSTLTIYKSAQPKILSIQNSTGVELAITNAVYLQIAAVFDTIDLTGFSVEAYRTNSNRRTAGQLITTDTYTQGYSVPTRTGISIIGPVGQDNSSNSDIKKLTNHIALTGMKKSIMGVDALVNYGKLLKAVTQQGVAEDIKLMGIGRHYVNAYYNEIDLVISDHVDSVKAIERKADIRSTLINYINDMTISMGLDSGYATAFNVMNPGKTMSVIIATDTRIASYLGSEKIDLGEYEVTVVSNSNPELAGKMYMTFSIFDGNRNVEVNPLSFGNCLSAPTVVTDLVKTVGGSTSREISNDLRYRHINNLPILVLFNVSGFENVIGKITANRHTV